MENSSLGACFFSILLLRSFLFRSIHCYLASGWYVIPYCKIRMPLVAIGAIVWAVLLIKTILTDTMRFIVPIQAPLLVSPSTHAVGGGAERVWKPPTETYKPSVAGTSAKNNGGRLTSGRMICKQCNELRGSWTYNK